MQLHKPQNHTHNVLDSSNVGRLLVTLAVPAFMGMFVQTMYNVINTIFMGQFVDSLAIAGLSIVFPIQMITFGIAQMVGMGGSSLISRYIGAGNIESAERTVGNGITVGIILAAIATVIILPFSKFWLGLIGASEEVMPYAQPYLMIIMSCTIFNVFAMTLLTFVRAEGNTRVGMVAMIMGAVLSIILDAIFVIVFKWGIVGAALATVISQVVSMLYMLSYYISGSSYLKIRMKNLRPEWAILKPMLSIGTAAFAQTVAGSLSSILLINMVINSGGDSALSAFGILQRVSMFAMMPGMVFAQALQPVLGYNYGAKRYGLGLKAVKLAVIVSTVLSFVGFTVLYLIPGPIMRIFTDDVSIIDVGIHASRLYFLSLPIIGSMMVGQIIFQAVGKAMQAFITAVVRPVVFLVPLALILSNLWKLDGTLLSVPASDFLTLLLVAVLVWPIVIQFSKLAKEEKQKKIDGVSTQELLPVPEISRIK